MMNIHQAMKQQAISHDGTEIAYWTSGVGPPLVVVHGVAADHTRWGPLLPYLVANMTVHAMDRRGRGASGDAPHYELAREFEDVAVVVDAVAQKHGCSVAVYGHSHGSFCAFGAAMLTSNIHKLVLYEGWPLPNPAVYALPKEQAVRMDASLNEGNREAVVELLFREVLQLPEDDIAFFKSAPSWPHRVAAAHTITREIRAEATATLQPDDASKLTCPVVLVIGELSSDPAKEGAELVAKTLPNARIVCLAGQGHIGDVMAPESFAALLISV